MMGFRDDQQASRAIRALLAPLPYRDLWTERGPSPRARLLLDRDLRSEGLTLPERFRLYIAETVWPYRGHTEPLSWAELVVAFARWEQRRTTRPIVFDDPRTTGDAYELVAAVHMGPDAVDGWLVCYAVGEAAAAIPGDALVVALALVDDAQRNARPYPSFAEVARATQLPHREVRTLLERLEQLGWATPPDVSRGRHAKTG